MKMRIQARFYSACISGNITKLKTISSYLPSVKGDDYHFLALVGEYGHLKVAEWIIKTYNVKLEESQTGCVKGFRQACAYGHLHVITWFVDVFKFNPENDYNNYGFQMACFSGHLDIAKWFDQRFKSLITNHFDKLMQAFEYACSMGHLELSTWLVDTFSLIVSESAVRNTCAYNRIEILQMFVAKNILKSSGFIHIIQRYWGPLLKTACLKGNKFMVFWLVINFPDLKILLNDIPEEFKQFVEEVLEENEIMIKPASKTVIM